MADRTSIEWTDATWNPVRGCARVSQGCRHCYAERVAARFSGEGQPYAGLIHPKTKGWNGSVMLVPEALTIPWRWVRPRRIFVNSMSDLFHDDVPFEFIAAVFWIMSVTTRHTYQVLTKRPARMLEFFRWLMDYGDEPGYNSAIWPLDHEHARLLLCNAVFDAGGDHPALQALKWEPATPIRGGYDNCGPGWPYANVWLGVSVEDQAAADERIPLLLEAPAAVRWISAEPLLGPINIDPYVGLRCDHEGAHVEPDTNALICRECDTLPHLDWVVTGGESGPESRPMSVQWARELRDQCKAAGVPFLFKQWGDWHPVGIRPPETPGRFAFGDWKHERRMQVTDRYPRMFNMFGARCVMERVGKKAAGRLLDGVLHDDYPEAA